MAAGLDRTVFEAVTRQLKAKAVRVKAGTIVDATIIASASEGDDDARWVKHKGRPAVHGFKAHVWADADTVLVEEVAVTPANINDGRAGPAAVPEKPGEAFADSAYRGAHFREAVRHGSPRPACGGGMNTRRWRGWRPSTRPSTASAGRIEKIFGTWKPYYVICCLL